MNKANKLILAGLMFCGVNSVFSMGNEQMEILRTLLKLEQNFADVPMITQNKDMFMGVVAMNIQILEADLKVANQKLKTVLLKNAALLIGAVVGRSVIVKADLINDNMAYGRFIKDIFSHGSISYGAVMQVLIGLNIHDAWKKRAALIEALALDKEILSKLEEIKDFSDQNSDSAEKILLENAA